MTTLPDYAYLLDFVGRFPFAVGPVQVRLAAHLECHPMLAHTQSLLSALKQGRDLAPHISPMKKPKSAFKKATRDGNWSRYAKVVDHLLNK